MNTFVEPIGDDDVDEEVARKFEDLIDSIYNVQSYGEEEQVIASNEHLHQKIVAFVNETPILARVISRELLHWSLLMTATEKTIHEYSHPTIKFLIEINPSALLWSRSDFTRGSSPIYAIAGHKIHCKLMPWIAERYSWI